MFKDKGIPIHNIYYMLSYAFKELRQSNYENIDKEEFDNIYDLLAEILFKGVSALLKHGLYKEYNNRCENMSTHRGKLDIRGTISNRMQRKNLLSVEYDELTENNIFNQIIKTTTCLLLRHSSVSHLRKLNLRSVLPFLSIVDEIDPLIVRWNTIRFQRSNMAYKMALNICYFVFSEVIMTTHRGSYKMITFTDECMSRLYEKFVLEYYKHHHNHLSPSACEIKWNIDKNDECVIDLLPSMKTDITLTDGNKTLIIDTKYYTKSIQNSEYSATIHSNNMYQIFAYVKNRDVDNRGDVSGMLLYAKTEEEITPNLQATFGKNKIYVKTLDLNLRFEEIKNQLDNIAKQAFG